MTDELVKALLTQLRLEVRVGRDYLKNIDMFEANTGWECKVMRHRLSVILGRITAINKLLTLYQQPGAEVWEAWLAELDPIEGKNIPVALLRPPF